MFGFVTKKCLFAAKWTHY